MNDALRFRLALARHDVQRWWHRRGVWPLVALVPRSIRYWILIKAINEYSWAHPDAEVPAIKAVDVLDVLS